MSMKEQTLELQLQCQSAVPYRTWIYVPKNYDPTCGEKWPVMLFLHGAGERGTDWELARRHGPGKLVKQGMEFPFIIVAPQCPADTCWWVHQLEALLDYTIANYAVDTDRIYVTGLSMGGHGTWLMGSYMPERLAAIAPICGWGNFVAPRTYGDLPIWAFHGDADDTVNPYFSEQMVHLINESGGNATLTMYTGVNHDSWTQTYENPELYNWLLSHRLSDRIQ